MIVTWERTDLLRKPSHEHRTTDGPAVIVISNEEKRRFWADHRSDEWSTLRRSDTPNLTDAEWFAKPGEDWTLRSVREGDR